MPDDCILIAARSLIDSAGEYCVVLREERLTCTCYNFRIILLIISAVQRKIQDLRETVFVNAKDVV